MGFLELERLSKRYDTSLAVDELSLSVGQGEFVALLGPSGCGKTTTLQMIAGFVAPSSGRIVLDGRDLGSVRPAQRGLGVVFQSYALFPHMTVAQNVSFGLEMQGVEASDRRSRVAEVLDMVGLTALADRYPRRMSGGQQQRVAVARALAREPQVLLLDEPFSAVDRATRQRLYRELAELRRGLAMPVILVTHDLDEALMLADQLCVLHQGRTLQVGEPYAVMTRPDSVEVAQLVGLRNVFRAGVVGHDEARAVTIIEWRGHRLEARLQTAFAAGVQVTWVIPQGHIMLHRRDRPSRGERENPVSGPVVECVQLGENVALTVAVNGPQRPPLFLTIPAHAARRNDIAVGVEIGLSLLADGIHLMPADDSRTPAKPR